MDSATLDDPGGTTAAAGALTLEMLTATFDEWRIFEGAGQIFACRSGVGFTPAGPQSLIRPVVHARTVDDLAQLLCMQARYLLMSAEELEVAWHEHIGTASRPEASFAGSLRDPAAELEAWSTAHPGCTVSLPSPPHLGMRVTVDGVVIAVAYGDLEALMYQVAVAEAIGGCPRHPRPAGEAP